MEEWLITFEAEDEIDALAIVIDAWEGSDNMEFDVDA